MDPVEAAALALADSRQKKEHGQLCPVWTQRLKKVRHAATIADCDCWILPDARRDAAIVVAALRAAPSTEPALDALRDALRLIELQPHGTVGPDRVPWFIHGGIAHGEPPVDCVACRTEAALRARLAESQS